MSPILNWITRNITGDEEFTDWLVACLLFLLVIFTWDWAFSTTEAGEINIGTSSQQLSIDEL